MQANAQIQSSIAKTDHPSGRNTALPVRAIEEKFPLGICWAVCGAVSIFGWFVILSLI